MAPGPLSVFSLFFPVVLFTGGAYIAYHGMNWKRGSLSGPASTDSPAVSHVSAQACVYCRTEVECYFGGQQGWKKVLVLEDRSPLKIGGKPIDVRKTLFDIKACNVFRGYVGSRFRNSVGEFLHYAQKTAPIEVALEVMDAAGLRDHEEFVGRNEYLSDDLVTSLLSQRGGDILVRYFGKPMRIRECIIAKGQEIHVSGLDESASTSEKVVSDANPESAEGVLREQGMMRLAIGCGLIVLSIMIAVLIFLS